MNSMSAIHSSSSLMGESTKLPLFNWKRQFDVRSACVTLLACLKRYLIFSIMKLLSSCCVLDIDCMVKGGCIVKGGRMVKGGCIKKDDIVIGSCVEAGACNVNSGIGKRKLYGERSLYHKWWRYCLKSINCYRVIYFYGVVHCNKLLIYKGKISSLQCWYF